MTRALAAELGPAGIIVNAIAPGFFAAESNDKEISDLSVADWIDHRTALGRWGNPTEIAGPAAFLASDEASYIAGQVLVEDGGLTNALLMVALRVDGLRYPMSAAYHRRSQLPFGDNRDTTSLA